MTHETPPAPRSFPLQAVLSVITITMLAKTKIEDIYELAEYLTGETAVTHALPEILPKARSIILLQRPDLIYISDYEEAITSTNVEGLTDTWIKNHGATIALHPHDVARLLRAEKAQSADDQQVLNLGTLQPGAVTAVLTTETLSIDYRELLSAAVKENNELLARVDEQKATILGYESLAREQSALLMKTAAMIGGIPQVVFNKQLFGHDPENNVFGDCYRTAIACLVGVEPDMVPHFNYGFDIEEKKRRLDEWLTLSGLSLIAVPMDGSVSLDDLLTSTALWSDHPCILAGKSRRGTDHVVIAHNGHIIWDPSTGAASDEHTIVGPADDGYWWIEYLVRFPSTITERSPCVLVENKVDSLPVEEGV